ncbi:DUF2771 family protein [Corynebacterium sp. 335C]
MARKSTAKGLTLLAVIVAVGLVITGIVVAVEYFRDDAVEDPSALELTVSVGGEEITVRPYRVCELGAECETDDANIASVAVGPQDVAEVTVPDEVAEGAWVLQRFYADEAMNGAENHEAGSATTVKVSGSESVAGKRSNLAVMEVSSASIVGVDDAGEETVYGVTWSVANDAA